MMPFIVMMAVVYVFFFCLYTNKKKVDRSIDIEVQNIWYIPVDLVYSWLSLNID